MISKKTEAVTKPEEGNATKQERSPDKLRYMRYYEHDGALRAYANRAMLLALISIPTALIAVGLAAYVRLQPPTVIRVNADGSAVGMGTNANAKAVSVSQGSNTEPNEFERKAYVRMFLERYLNFSPDTVNRNFAEGLNMMTGNLRRASLNVLQKENVVGKIQDDQITSVFRLLSLEPAKDDPLAFTAFGVRDVHRVRDHQETTDKLIGEFHIRLIGEKRTEENPGGLLIAEYGERLIEGERRDAMMRDAGLTNPN